MEYIKYLLICVLFLMFKNLEAQTSNVDLVLRGSSKLNKNNWMVIKISFVNNSKDSISFYHPGILAGAFAGYYAKNSPLYSLGILKSDTVLYWKGNCFMEYPRQKVYLSFKNGLTVLFHKKQEKLRNRKFIIPPGKIVSQDILLIVRDCYQLEKNQKYSFSLTYNHPFDAENCKIKTDLSTRVYYRYSATASFDFIYTGSN